MGPHEMTGMSAYTGHDTHLPWCVHGRVRIRRLGQGAMEHTRNDRC